MNTNLTTKESTLINMANPPAYHPHTSCYTAQSVQRNCAQCKSYTKNPKSLIAHTGQIFYMITFNSQNPHTKKEKNCNNLKRSHPYTPFHALLVSLRG